MAATVQDEELQDTLSGPGTKHCRVSSAVLYFVLFKLCLTGSGLKIWLDWFWLGLVNIEMLRFGTSNVSRMLARVALFLQCFTFLLTSFILRKLYCQSIL